MTICSQNLDDDDLTTLKKRREQDPEFDKRLAQIVEQSIALRGGGRNGALQKEIDRRTRLEINTPTPGPTPAGRRSRRRDR